jgi:hypothetical protein
VTGDGAGPCWADWATIMIGQLCAAESHWPQPNDVDQCSGLHWYGFGMVMADRNYSTCPCTVVSYCSLRIADPPLRSPQIVFCALLRFLPLFFLPFLSASDSPTTTFLPIIVPPNPLLSFRHLDSFFYLLYIPPTSSFYTSSLSLSLPPFYNLQLLARDLYTRWLKLAYGVLLT